MKFTENTTVTWQNMRSTDYRHKKKASSTATHSVMSTWRERNRRDQYEKPSDKARISFYEHYPVRKIGLIKNIIYLENILHSEM